MEKEPDQRPIRIKVSDKRRSSSADESEAGVVEPDEVVMEEPEEVAEQSPKHDYLDDLRRVQAEFDNYRKRVLREQTVLADRASARLVERLLPVLDNFESAVAHGEGGAGVEMVYRELIKILEEEGLEEIKAEGVPFDPSRHEAFEAIEDEGVTEPVCRKVVRRGYALKGQVLRPVMVVVARPPEAPAGESETGSARDNEDAAEG
jgi:molecular chaperone GrpE